MEPEKITGKAKFITPFLFNKPPARVKRSRTSPPDEVLKREAMEKIHRNAEGNIIIPGDMIKAATVNVSKLLNKKLNRKPLYNYLKPLLFVHDFDTGLTEPDYMHFIQTPNKAQQLIPNFRPMLFAEREFQITAAIFGEIVPMEDLKECIASAGRLIGIGSWRPKYG